MPLRGPVTPKVQDAFTEFLSGFSRSRKGNLWRTWGGLTVTVFPDRQGFYNYCLAGPRHEGGPRFGPGGYLDESDALEVLWGTLEEREQLCK